MCTSRDPGRGPPRPLLRRRASPRVRRRRSAAYFAASAAGSKETTSTRGSASRRCATERAQEATPASAPKAPGRLGREDARILGERTLGLQRRHAPDQDVADQDQQPRDPEEYVADEC